jgi:membrane protein
MASSGRTPRWRRAWRFARRVQKDMSEDNLTLIAAGVAFYWMLSLFPAIIGVVTVYGLVADAQQVREQLDPVVGGLPPDARELVYAQLIKAVEAGDSGLTIGLVVSLLATIWAASGGTQALMTGLNVISEQRETRGFPRLKGTALGLTVGALVTAAAALGLIAVFPIALDWLGVGPAAATVAEVTRWLLLVVLVGIGLAVMYRYGPAPHGAHWRWITPGTVSAVAVWLVASAGFTLYVSSFESYDKTYGSLAAVIVLLLWLYLSAIAILLGAEIDQVRGEAATDPAAAERAAGDRAAGDRAAGDPPADLGGPVVNGAGDETDATAAAGVRPVSPAGVGVGERVNDRKEMTTA